MRFYNIICPGCDGEGRRVTKNDKEQECPACSGKGFQAIWDTDQSSFGLMPLGFPYPTDPYKYPINYYPYTICTTRITNAILS